MESLKAARDVRQSKPAEISCMLLLREAMKRQAHLFNTTSNVSTHIAAITAPQPVSVKQACQQMNRGWCVSEVKAFINSNMSPSVTLPTIQPEPRSNKKFKWSCTVRGGRAATRCIIVPEAFSQLNLIRLFLLLRSFRWKVSSPVVSAWRSPCQWQYQHISVLMGF